MNPNLVERWERGELTCTLCKFVEEVEPPAGRTVGLYLCNNKKSHKYHFGYNDNYIPGAHCASCEKFEFPPTPLEKLVERLSR